MVQNFENVLEIELKKLKNSSKNSVNLKQKKKINFASDAKNSVLQMQILKNNQKFQFKTAQNPYPKQSSVNINSSYSKININFTAPIKNSIQKAEEIIKKIKLIKNKYVLKNNIQTKSAFDFFKSYGINFDLSIQPEQVKKVYRRMTKDLHPDLNPNLPVKEFYDLQSAYESLNSNFVLVK